ncbi:dTDP-glucose 4-6-dehydratase-like [Brachionus plicatilis]|uniref:dTDP-glucose 4-6-dehydratase-like n=1 Tax=Brachionus plicatilis TaxID=10195 RepID=A0A3M7Q0G2_BRAPC|nr:dTDP-glucose 4-6-dehydratase-like [Brachionus plicatilis]
MKENIQQIHVLITGGAGYIGSALVPMLIEKNFKVTVYDLFNYGSESLIACSLSENLTLIKGDIRDEEKLKEALKYADIVVHLAAIVGYPACSKDPELAMSTNVLGTKLLAKNMRKDQKLIFSSTGSCYGAIPDGFCSEDTPLSPLSLYGQTKVEGEKIVQEANGISLRLATIFGISQRLRLDLLINHLTYKALTEKHFEVYEPHFRRTFLHIRDVARAFVFTIENYEKMQGQVFNVGSDSLNFTKLDICHLIKNALPDCVITPTDSGTDADKRDYQVSYAKIRNLGFKPTVTVQDGIKELMSFLPYLSDQFIKQTTNV